MSQQASPASPGTKPSNPWEASSAAYQRAGAQMAGASAPGAAAGMYGTYMNPYTDDVVNRTVADAQRQAQMGVMDINSTAHGQGAFGGARHGLAEGAYMGEVNRNLQDTVANLRSGGYNTAMDLAGRDVDRQMSGANAMENFGGTMMDVGRTLTGQQTQDAGRVGAINDALIGQGAGMFDRFTGQPLDSAMAILGALSGNPLAGTGTQTQTSNPGTKSKLGAALGVGSRVASGGKGG